MHMVLKVHMQEFEFLFCSNNKMHLLASKKVKKSNARAFQNHQEALCNVIIMQ